MPTWRPSRLSYALDVLEARGELEPSGPEAQQWVQRLPHRYHDARGGSHARPAPQLPQLARLQRGADLRPRVRAQQRAGRVGDGVRADQPEPSRRTQHGRLAAGAGPVRLLGDRVRLQADRAGAREGRAAAYCGAQQRAAARLRHRRRQLPRRRSGVAAFRPRQRPGLVCKEALRHRTRSDSPTGDARAQAQRGLLGAAPFDRLCAA